jgi:hypothetical protein
MSNRSLLFLILFLTLPGISSAQTPTVQVLVYDRAGLEPTTLHRFVERTKDILVTAGLSVQVEACARGAEDDPCATHTGSARRLQVRVIPRSAKSTTKAGHSPLGESFADHDGGTYASVFLDRVTDEAAETNVPMVTVLAYTAAHEIGHLLLGDETHTPRGLMKAKWDRNDFQAMCQGRLHFNEDQSRELANRFGVSRPENIAASLQFAGTR